MRRGSTLATAALLAVGGAVHGSSTGPQPGLAGVPAGGGFAAEMTCVACHASSPLNPDRKGRIVLEGLPARYVPGARYALTLAVSHPDPSRRRWGFALTAVATRTFEGAGEIVVTEPRATQVVRGDPAKRQYVGHGYEGTGPGETGGHRWTFDWVAPAEDVGDVAFFASVNAADLDGSKEGDFIYSPTPAPVAVVRGPEEP